MQEMIIKYIEEELSNEELDDGLEVDEDLLGSGILDSLGMVKLISFIETEFGYKVEPEEMLIENFMTVSHVMKYLGEKSK